MANSQTWLAASQLHHTLPDGRCLFDGLELALDSQLCALIGENGVGKSTLAALLAGAIPTESGARIQRHGRIGYLPQQLRRPAPGECLADFLGHGTLFRALQRIELGEGSADDFEVLDDHWQHPARLAALLSQFALPTLEPLTPIDHLSGGQLARLALVRLLFDEPEHLILDEPGNHLDRAGRRLLAEWLRGFPGGVLLISHDRQLLSLATSLLDLGPWGLRRFSGNYAAYRDERDHERERQAQAVAAEQRQLQRARAEAQRNLEKHQRRAAKGKAARRSGSQSKLLLDREAERSEQTSARLSRLARARLGEANERLAQAQGRHDPEGSVRLVISELELSRSRRPVLSVEGLRFAYPGGPLLFDGLAMQLAAGERLELRGANGCGKSTLLKLLSGELEPQAGKVARHVPLARLDQHLSILDPAASALENFRRLAPGFSPHEYYARLDAMGLPRERVGMKVEHLSGGERVRLALAILLLGPETAELLLLDEPSNHLDLVASEALEAAISAYRGALVVVSHDDPFLERIGIDRVVELCA